MSKNKTNLVEIEIDHIYFTHSKIYPQFSGCGKTLKETLLDIHNIKIRITDIPFITIIPSYDNSCFFSLNNRRLWVFKQLSKTNNLKTIMVRIKPFPKGKKNRKKYKKELLSKSASIMSKKVN